MATAGTSSEFILPTNLLYYPPASDRDLTSIPTLASTVTLLASVATRGGGTKVETAPATTTSPIKMEGDWETGSTSPTSSGPVKERRQTLVEFSNQVGIELAWAFAEMLAIKFGVSLKKVALDEL